MVDFATTFGVVTSFVSNVLSLPFFGLGTFGNFVLVCLLAQAFVDGGDK